jgi:hypothetical protein
LGYGGIREATHIQNLGIGDPVALQVPDIRLGGGLLPGLVGGRFVGAFDEFAVLERAGAHERCVTRTTSAKSGLRHGGNWVLPK